MIRTTLATSLRAAGALLVVAAVAACSQAQVINDVGGFEAAAGYSTTFNPMLPGSYVGQLEGQVFPPVFPNGTFQVPVGGTGTSTAKVVSGTNSTLGPAGTQAVQVTKGDRDGRWGIHNSTYPSPGRSQICIDWDMQVLGPSGGANQFGPFFGVESYYDQGGGVPVHGYLGVDSTTGAVLIGEAGTGNFKSPDGLAEVTFGSWNHFRMVLDFTANKYVSFLNGVQLGAAEGFVDGAIPFWTDAPIVALSEGPNFANIPGVANFDNFSVHEGQFCTIPEPAGLVLAAAGLAIVAVRRRLAS